MRKSLIPLLVALLAACSGVFADDSARGMTEVPEQPGAGLKIGRQFLVVIAVSKYEHWMPLPDPAKDAREIWDILVSRYRIDERRELYDEQATKGAIIKLLVDLQGQLKPDDSLLILYSGHGHLDSRSDTGFWIPFNAGTDVYEQLNWLPHSQLKGLISKMPSTHVLVISDSCFAGDLLASTRSLPEAVDWAYLQKAYSLVCRLVLTSGATEPVPTASNFASLLKSALRENTNPFLDGIALYNQVRTGMKSTIPLLGALAGTGHQEGASFLLFLKEGMEGTGTESKIAQGGPTAGRPGVWDGSLWVGSGFQEFFPILDMAGSISMGPALLPHIVYTLPTRFGWFGMGIFTGVTGFRSKGVYPSEYSMLSFPLALAIRYQTAFRSPFFLTIDLATGCSLNRVLFDKREIPSITNLSLFLWQSFSAGWQFTDRLRVTAGCGLASILFTRPLVMLCPILRVEYAIIAPKAGL